MMGALSTTSGCCSQPSRERSADLPSQHLPRSCPRCRAPAVWHVAAAGELNPCSVLPPELLRRRRRMVGTPKATLNAVVRPAQEVTRRWILPVNSRTYAEGVHADVYMLLDLAMRVAMQG
mmetsp:Transcript_42623/g.127386  ORF Transcript_42623/g.127386 Transcript_42623/m.127386 type:complete len:120 (+) Transcript_42623:129-488(+)